MSPSSQTFQFPEVRVVEASAGSGKTFALAKRYVQLLLNPKLQAEQVPIRQILAITFTNKAAFEMKARILYFLKKIALQALSADEEKELLLPIELSAEQASPKAFAVMEAVIYHYNFFQVQTIDSFVNALLSGCAFKIGLSANFKIKRNSVEYLEYSLDQMIENAASDDKVYRTLSGFLHQYLFLENKPGWFPKKDMLGLLFAMHHQRNVYGGEFIPSEVQAEDVIKMKKNVLKDMRDLQAQLPEGTDSRFVKSLDGFLEKYSHGFDFDRLSDYFAREMVPVRKGTDIPSSLDDLWQKIHGQLRRLSEAEAYSLFNPYMAVFSLACDYFQQKAAKDDVLFLEELNRKARSLFDEGMITVEELYYRLATRFHHYLIDEFQDTSLLQWQNLYLMIEEALSTGGSLFYVGDKKQAIYGFRGGEAGLFDGIQEQLKAFNVQHDQLTHNYRSQKAVVDFNNALFSAENLRRFIDAKEDYEVSKKKKDAVFLTSEERSGIENVFQGAQQIVRGDKPNGYVKVHRVSQTSKEARDEETRDYIIGLVHKLKKRYAYGDMAILTRGNKDVEAVTYWLMEEGIPVESERTLNVKENRLVQEMMSFLQFLNSPIDNMAFARFVQGDAFLKASGMERIKVQNFLLGLRERLREEHDVYLYREFRRNYPEIWKNFIDEFFKNVGLYPLYELAVSIVNCWDLLAHFPGQQGFIMKLLEIIKVQEAEASEISSFLEGFEDIENELLYINVSDEDSVRVQTIHKTKGLEFPVVILPFLGMDIHTSQGGAVGQQSFLIEPKDAALEILRIKSKYLPYSSKLTEIRRRAYIKSFVSELNSVYVAVTRASEELYVCIPSKVGNAHNVVNWLIPENFLEGGTLSREKFRPRNREYQNEVLPVSQYCDWIEFLEDEFRDAGEIFHRDQISKGNMAHFLLSHIGTTHQQDFDELIRASMDAARQHFSCVENESEHEKQLKGLLSHPDLQDIFFVKDGDVYQEIDVADTRGQTRRIDRLIVREDEVWVVDYKSTKQADDTYAKQVGEYMRIARELFPKKKVRGFLLYLDTFAKEEVS